MSYGTYDNQGPLNQPFNPTANNGIGSDIGRSIGNSIATSLFGENAQGPLSGLTRQIPGMAINAVANLPGAPSLEAQRNVEQSRAGGGILKLRQQPPMLGQQPGGKSGKSFQPMPSQPVERSQDMPTPMPAVQPAQQPGGKSGGGGMQFGNGKSAGPISGIQPAVIDPNQFARGDGMTYDQQMQAQPGIAADSNIGRAFGSGFFGGSMIPVNASGDTGQSALQKAQTDFFRGP
jgi:hypothetical protein